MFRSSTGVLFQRPICHENLPMWRGSWGLKKWDKWANRFSIAFEIAPFALLGAFPSTTEPGTLEPGAAWPSKLNPTPICVHCFEAHSFRFVFWQNWKSLLKQTQFHWFGHSIQRSLDLEFRSEHQWMSVCAMAQRLTESRWHHVSREKATSTTAHHLVQGRMWRLLQWIRTKGCVEWPFELRKTNFDLTWSPCSEINDVERRGHAFNEIYA